MTPPTPRPTAFLLPRSGLEHDTGAGHPEHAGRLQAVAAAMERAHPGFGDHVEDLDAAAATLDDLLAVHTPDEVQRVREAARIAEDRQVLVGLDPDTRVSPGSWTAAMDAAGAAIGAVRTVSEGSHANAFVAARPPGHHATRELSMGFCLFNNVAVAARSLQRSGSAEGVLIVDWDVHHGNGTQDIFYTDPSVCYVSLHQSPHYPGTGAADETGAGEGRGLTINVPLPAGLGRDAYRRRFEDALDRVADVFTPDFVLVSAGFDVLAGTRWGVKASNRWTSQT